MKRFLPLFFTLPMTGCANGFFIEVELQLNNQDIQLLAVDPGDLREIEVRATPDNGEAPAIFTIPNIPRLPPGATISYALELPKNFEGVPLLLEHRGFSTNTTITEPVVFGSITAITENNQVNGAQLTVKDPKCNNIADGDDFCFGPALKAPSDQNQMISLNIDAQGDPIVLFADDSRTLTTAFSVSTAGLFQVTNFGFPYPFAGPLQAMTLLDFDPGNNFASVAILQNNQIFVRLPNGVAGAEFPAAESFDLTAARLNIFLGRDIIGISPTGINVFLDNAGTQDFDAPIVINTDSPRAVETRKINAANEQFSVATSSQLLTFAFNQNPPPGQIQQVGRVDLPPGANISALALGDLDNDNLDDAVLTDNNGSKLYVVLLDASGNPKGTINEIPLTGDLRAIAIGRFDDNGSVDIAVAGNQGNSFVQFILSPALEPRVTPPRVIGQDPRAALPVKIGTQGQALGLVVGTVGESTVDIFIPEL